MENQAIGAVGGTGTTAGLTAAATGAMGRNEFLKLLVTQLENQDPLEPLKDQEFVAQLATFSSLEQLIDMNKRMDGLLSGQTDLVNSQALNLVGRAVVADTAGQVRVDGASAEEVIYELPQTTSKVSIEIADSTGKVVRAFDSDQITAGRHSFRWDGLDDADHAVADGTYTVRISTNDGKTTAKLRTFTVLPVDGIRFDASGLSMISRGRVIPFSSVLEVRDGNSN